MKKRFSTICVPSIITSVLLTACSGSAALSESKGIPDSWTSKFEIEFVVPPAPNGGSDINARIIADIVSVSGHTPRNFKVNNMPGGSGEAAFSYAATKGDNDEILVVLHNGQIMSILANGSPVVAADLTCLPAVALGSLLLCINKNEKYRPVEEMIGAAKANPSSVKIGGSQRGNTDHPCFEIMRKYLDVGITYVQLNFSEETISVLLGGHVDSGIPNLSERVGRMEVDEVLPMITLANDCLSGQLAEVHTSEEIGCPDILVTEIRILPGTLEMSAEAIAFHDGTTHKVTKIECWKTEYIEKNYLTPAFMTFAEAKEFFDQETEKYNSIFKEVGVVQ